MKQTGLWRQIILKPIIRDLLSGPQTEASAVVGRLLEPQEIDSVGGGYFEKCYGKTDGGYTKYVQQDGCGPYGQGS